MTLHDSTAVLTCWVSRLPSIDAAGIPLWQNATASMGLSWKVGSWRIQADHAEKIPDQWTTNVQVHKAKGCIECNNALERLDAAVPRSCCYIASEYIGGMCVKDTTLAKATKEEWQRGVSSVLALESDL